MKDFMRRHFQRETTHQPPCPARPCSPSIEICEWPYHNTKVVILLRAFLSTILLHTDAITGYVLRQYTLSFSYIVIHSFPSCLIYRINQLPFALAKRLINLFKLKPKYSKKQSSPSSFLLAYSINSGSNWPGVLSRMVPCIQDMELAC